MGKKLFAILTNVEALAHYEDSGCPETRLEMISI